MKRIKIIFWSLMLVSTFGLNSFAAETRTQMKTLSQEGLNSLETVLQTEKEKTEQNSAEAEEFFGNDPIYISTEGPKITLNKRKQTYIFKRQEKPGENGYCKIRKTDKKIIATKQSSLSDVPVVGSVTEGTREIEFFIKSPAIDPKTGKNIPNSLSLIVTKSMFNSDPVDFQLSEIFFSTESKMPSEIHIQYNLNDGTGEHLKTLAYEDCFFVDKTPEYLKKM